MGSFQSLPRPVRVWLLTGVVMVFFQVVLGGITRLTDSGLSITEWAVIQGTLPPLNEAEWQEAFAQYKVMARKQYETLHRDMSLQEFKFIYFWEYFHRLWARLMGLVFLLPFLWFVWKKMLPRWLLRRLGIVMLLASLAAVFGWIMVKSGLNNDQRTWVSAYKLVVHLSIATVLFAYLFWTWLLAARPAVAQFAARRRLRRAAWLIVGVVLLQIAFGGLMAGMRAGLIHPHWPVFVKGHLLWQALTETTDWHWERFIDYEPARAIKAIVQLLHRGTAWVLVGLALWWHFRLRRWQAPRLLVQRSRWFYGMLGIQFVLGVLTVINCVGRVPVFWGVVHQGGALLTLASALLLAYSLRHEHA